MENMRLTQNVINNIVEMNDKIFEQERIIDDLEHAISANRYYLAAQKSEDRVLDLYAAMKNLKAARERLETLKQTFEWNIEHVYADSYQETHQSKN